MKKLLILNGSHSDIPLIKAGKKLGYYVITTGNQPNLIGHGYADEYHNANFSEKDAVLDLAKSLNIDAICACANDFGAITAAYIAEKLGLPGHDPYYTCLQIHHKDKFKALANKLHLTSPMALSFTNISDALTHCNTMVFPAIAKPIDMTGGKGITKINDPSSYSTAIERAFIASRSKRIVVEEYIPGSLHSFTTFLQNQRVIFHFCDNEYSYINPYLVSSSAAPAFECATIRKQLIDELERIAKNLGLVDGVLHTQYILNNGRAWILEITRRCSGDFYPVPVSASCNIDWAEWIIKGECGLNCSDFPVTTQQGHFGRHCIMANSNGVIENIIIDDRIKNNIFDTFMMMSQGDHVTDYLIDKLGVLFLTFSSIDEIVEKMLIINDLVKVKIRE